MVPGSGSTEQDRLLWTSFGSPNRDPGTDNRLGVWADVGILAADELQVEGKHTLVHCTAG